MSAYFTKIYADSETALKEKANKTMKDLGFMRQPEISKVGVFQGDDNKVQWYAIIKYWGLD